METEQIVSLLIAERDRISQAIEALQGPARRGRPRATRSTNPAPAAATPKKRRLSAAGRKAIAEAARRRWAAVKKAAAPAAPSALTKKSAPQSKPAPKKRRITAAGRKVMADAAKRRWAAIRAGKAEGTKAEGSTAPSEDEQFKKRMSEVMKASWAKRRKATAKKKAA
jgi:hypothetical protein